MDEFLKQSGYCLQIIIKVVNGWKTTLSATQKGFVPDFSLPTHSFNPFVFRFYYWKSMADKRSAERIKKKSENVEKDSSQRSRFFSFFDCFTFILKNLFAFLKKSLGK